jgi:murein tripeptide amidase MpaA
MCRDATSCTQNTAPSSITLPKIKRDKNPVIILYFSMPIKISQQFDSGAIDVVQADSANQIDLNLRKDSHADIHQWFHFRLQGARGQACTIRFLNAGQATYAEGLRGLPGRASYDTENWFRVPTTFDGQVMTVSHTP